MLSPRDWLLVKSHHLITLVTVNTKYCKILLPSEVPLLPQKNRQMVPKVLVEYMALGLSGKLPQANEIVGTLGVNHWSSQ